MVYNVKNRPPPGGHGRAAEARLGGRKRATQDKPKETCYSPLPLRLRWCKRNSPGLHAQEGGAVMIRVPKILLGLLFMAFASSANTLFANTLFLYQISYDATSGPIQSFGVSFVSQNLLTGSSGAFAFNPFPITDGTDAWVMGKAIATFSKFGFAQCLNFATLDSFFPVCGVEVFSDHEGGFSAFFRDSLPTQPGTFTPDGVLGAFTIDPNTAEFFQVPGTGSLGTGSFNFKITEVPVPEPSTWLLIASGLIGIAFLKKYLPE